MTLERPSPCKVNLLLNILGKRPDGFHELETVMHPVSVCDMLAFTRRDAGLALTCSDARLPVDETNLVWRAARKFFEAAGLKEGVGIHLEKRIPMAAGLGGGSGNAAVTLLGLNELFGHPLAGESLRSLAASLGSDVPFFLQDQPGWATGRGEAVVSLPPFAAMRGTAFVLVHPGFGISTAWAYQTLARYPASLCGMPGRAERLIALLNGKDLQAAGAEGFNALEAPAFGKFPVLALFKEFFTKEGAALSLMSGSGSAVFGIFADPDQARAAEAKFLSRFGRCWSAVVAV